jgi:superfamily I DNA/RNA helicase
MADARKEIGIDSGSVDYHWHWEKQNTKKSKYLIVDEAQDFSEADIEKFKQNGEVVLLYGDSAQQLYAFRKDNPPLTIEEISVLTGYPTEQLVFNHRLPKTIARVAEKISATKDDLEGRCTNDGSEKPYILRYDSIDEQFDAIAEIIGNRDFEDVGILFRYNRDVESAAEYFRNIGLMIEAKTRDQMDLNWGSSNPKVLTYHSAKGLQFEAVFLPKCTCDYVEDRSPLYVAMTRTYHSLYIMHSGNLSPFFNHVPKDLYQTSLAAKATELL